MATSTDPTPVIIDTDPGVDDALAILMALASPELEVIGLTTVFGNAATDVTTRNAQALLELTGRSDIPLSIGRSDPLTTSYLGPVPHVHGADGLGDGGLSPTSASSAPGTTDAATALYEAVAARPGEVTVLTLGPVTNLADALNRYPDMKDLVGHVVVMGGNALVPGNATPSAEANINNDAEAADIVFGAGWPVTMVGLDVTQRVIMDGTTIDRIAGGSTASAEVVAKAVPLYRNFFEATNGIDGIFLHDPSTVAYLLDPNAFTVERWPIRVETESFSRGKTWPNLGNTDDAAPPAWQGRPAVAVCTGVDTERVVALVAERLAR